MSVDWTIFLFHDAVFPHGILDWRHFLIVTFQKQASDNLVAHSFNSRFRPNPRNSPNRPLETTKHVHMNTLLFKMELPCLKNATHRERRGPQSERWSKVDAHLAYPTA